MRNKPLAIADKPFRIMKANTSKRISFYLQGQLQAVGMLLIVCLFTSCNTGKPGAPTKHGEATVPTGASSPTSHQARVGEQQGSKPPLVKELRALAPDPLQARGGEQQGDDSLPATSRALAPDPLLARGGEQQGDDSLPATSRALVPDPLPAPGGEQQGDDSLPATSRALVPDPLPAQDGEQQGDDSLPATSRALASDPLPARGGEQKESDALLVKLRALASDPQIDQQPDELAELGTVLLKLAASKQAAGASHQDLSPYTEAAILYQHVLSISAQEDAQKKKILASKKAKELADSAYQGLAHLQASMLAHATGAAPRATTSGSPNWRKRPRLCPKI